MEVFSLLKKRLWGIAGAVILLVVILLAAFSPLIAPYHYNEIDIQHRMGSPGSEYLLGTDQLGRDLFSRLLYGSRPYAGTGLIATGSAIVLGLILGFSFRKSGSRLEAAPGIVLFSLAAIAGLIVLVNLGVFILRFLPFRFITMALTFIGHGIEETGLVMVITGLLISLILLPSSYLFMRKAFRQDTSRQSLFSLSSIITVYAGVGTGLAVLILASMGFLGFGIPPPLPEWGHMLSSFGLQYSNEAPWMAAAPAIALAVTVLGLVIFAPAVWEIWLPRPAGAADRHQT